MNRYNERVFLEQALYDIDDEIDLVFILKDGNLLDMKGMKELEGVQYFSLWKKDYSGMADYSGIRYYGLADLEADIGVAYDVNNSELINKINSLCIEINAFYKENKESLNKFIPNFDKFVLIM